MDLDLSRLVTLRQEAERCLRQQLEAKYPDLARLFEVRLEVAGTTEEYVDW